MAKIKCLITPCLWFDSQAEEAARFYTGVFPQSKIKQITRYGKEGREVHGQAEGTVLTVEFELAGQAFTALNGGPLFQFTEAVSFQVACDTQQEVDDYWAKLGAGGDEKAQQCGWLKDKYGLSWQIVPGNMAELMDSSNPAAAGRVMTALLQMKKLDLAALNKAHAGA